MAQQAYMRAVLNCVCVYGPASTKMAAIKPRHTLSLHSKIRHPDLHTWLLADALTGAGSMRVFNAAPNLCCVPVAPDLPVQVG